MRWGFLKNSLFFICLLFGVWAMAGSTVSPLIAAPTAKSSPTESQQNNITITDEQTKQRVTVTPQAPDTSGDANTLTPQTTSTSGPTKLRVIPKQGSEELWNFQNADIRAVIDTVSKLTGKNFIVDPRVQGKITIISQKPMTSDEIYQVFLSMLDVLNYAAIPSGNVIKIVPSAQAKQYGGLLATRGNPGSGDEVVVRVVPVDNVSAEQLVPVLRPLVQDWGTVSAYNPSNTLILAGTANNVSRLVDIINNIDANNATSTQVITLKRANAEKVAQLIQSLQASDRAEGKISNVSVAADAGTNSIVISGNRQNRNQTMRLIQQLDRAGGNGDGNTEVVHLNYLPAKEMATILTNVAKGTIAQTQKGKGGTSSAESSEDQTVSIQAEKNDNALIINAPQSMIRNLNGVIHQLDVRPQQVLVEAIIVQVDQSLLHRLGIIWGTENETGQSNTNVSDVAPQIANTFNPGMGFIPHGNIQALVQALTTSASTNILATPSIVVLNNQTATITDGKNLGIINRQYALNNTQNPTNNVQDMGIYNTIQRQDVALTLKVTPQISPRLTVRMKIDQTNDTVDVSSESTPDNPVFDTSKIQTGVLVRSGDILVLGGLINNNQRRGLTKVPILGDIPIIGNLFRYRNRDIDKKNLMVFIRPVILSNGGLMSAVTRQRYNYMRKQEIWYDSGLDLQYMPSPLVPKVSKGRKVRLPQPF